jgi:serine O-acetyltransferase
MEMVMRAHLASASLQRNGFQPLAKLADRMIRLVFGAIIPSEADIHRTVKFFHNGFGVAITKETRIAENCQIGSGVVLASRWPVTGGPILEQGVVVYANAVLVGPVKIAEESVIAANSLVTTNVPARCLVGGNPARLFEKDIDPSKYRYPVD